MVNSSPPPAETLTAAEPSSDVVPAPDGASAAAAASTVRTRRRFGSTRVVQVASTGADVVAAAPDQTAPDQTAPDQTAPDQTAPDQTAPDQTALQRNKKSADEPAEVTEPAVVPVPQFTEPIATMSQPNPVARREAAADDAVGVESAPPAVAADIRADVAPAEVAPGRAKTTPAVGGAAAAAGPEHLVADDARNADAGADLAVAATGGPTPTGATATGVGVSELPGPAKARSRRSGKVFAGVAAIIPIAIIATVLVLVLGRSSDHKKTDAAVGATSTTSDRTVSSGPSGSTAPGSASVGGSTPAASAQAQFGRWAKANISTSAVIVADARTAKALRAAGFTDIVQDTSTTTDWHTVAYLVSSRGDTPPSALRAQVAAAAAPVAEFGSGTSEVTVSQVQPQLGSDLAARIRADRLARRQAGTELVKNPMVRFSPSARQAVSAGLLDLRPASFLVQLGRTTPVYVTDVVCNAAESRAGRPCRTIVVSTGDMNMLQQAVSSSALEYKPITVQQIDQDAVRLQWMPAITSIAGG